MIQHTSVTQTGKYYICMFKVITCVISIYISILWEMIIRLRSYIFRDSQCKWFAVGRKSSFSKESDPPRSADRLSALTLNSHGGGANDPPEISCLLNIFMIFRGVHTRSYYHYTAQPGADRRIDSSALKSHRDEVTRRRNAPAEIAAFEFI